MLLAILIVILLLIMAYWVYSNAKREGFVSASNDQFRTCAFGTDWSGYLYGNYEPEKPFLKIILFYSACCRKHNLIPIFRQVARENRFDGIKFDMVLVDPSVPQPQILPHVVKLRRNGQVIHYTGSNDFGELQDWVMEENQLFDVSGYGTKPALNYTPGCCGLNSLAPQMPKVREGYAGRPVNIVDPVFQAAVAEEQRINRL